MEVYRQIAALADGMQEELSAFRRDFHKYAEPGWLEMRTSSIIARRLTELGYEVLTGDEVCAREARMGVPADEVLERQYARAAEQGADPEFVQRTRGGMTGVIGLLHCGEGPTVAMRFDIDALGVFEESDTGHLPAREGFASVNEGAMHACGHDGHAAIGLGVARVLMELRGSLRGTVKLIFQPAEEGVRGARAIVEKGHLDDVQYLLGSHISAKKPQERAVVIPGSYGSLATSKYDVVFHGKSAHAGGSPHLGKNVMLAMATAVLNLYAIPRHGEGETRVNVGRVTAGSGRNVIADEAAMEIEVRGETTEINRFMTEYATAVLQIAAAMHGCTCELRLMGAADSLSSDRALAERVARVCRENLQLPVSDTLCSKNGGSEDFSYMMNRVQARGGQATFMRVLTSEAGPAHSRRFDFGEQVLPNAVKIFCGTVYDILKA